MLKYLLLSITTASLIGCSSTPEITSADPYCYTNEEVVTQNGSVSATTTVSCSDDPLKRAKLVGVDPLNCRPWQRRDYVNGYEKSYGGYICRDAKGNWRPLNQF